MGAVGVGGSVVSGIIGNNAAKSAANIQSAAADQAGQKVTQAVDSVNPLITGSAQTGAANVNAAAASAGAGATSAADRANALVNPYTTTGINATEQLDRNIASGAYSSAPTMDQLQMDPGYQFRLQQGQQALERSAAARGGVNSGGYLKSLTDYSQGSASQEYQNAFNRSETNKQNNFANLSSLAGQGMSAGNTEGQNLIGAAKYVGDTGIAGQQYGSDLNYNAANATAQNTIGGAKSAADYLTQGANAQAAGKIGGANAITGAIGSGVNAAMGAGQLYGMLKNPATSGPASYARWTGGH